MSTPRRIVLVEPARRGWPEMTRNLTETDDCKHCPACGAQGSVFKEDGEGDYYCGPTYFCVGCGASGSMWSAEPDERLRALLAAALNAPR